MTQVLSFEDESRNLEFLDQLKGGKKEGGESRELDLFLPFFFKTHLLPSSHPSPVLREQEVYSPYTLDLLGMTLTDPSYSFGLYIPNRDEPVRSSDGEERSSVES